jgi:hypothetical protein
MFEALLAVVTSNSAALRELRTRSVWSHPRLVGGPLDTYKLVQLLAAAPRLTLWEADATCNELALARRLLLNEPPFERLRVRSLKFNSADVDIDEDTTTARAAVKQGRVKAGGTASPPSYVHAARMQRIQQRAAQRGVRSLRCATHQELRSSLARLVQQVGIIRQGCQREARDAAAVRLAQ